MAWHIRPLSDAVGVEVLGVDLARPLAAADHEALQAHLDRYKLLVFRDQDLTADQHVAAVGRFGPVADEFDDGTCHSLVTERHDPDFALTGWLFHQDYAFTAAPPPLLSLHALAVEGAEVATIFANNVRGQQSLHWRDQLFVAKQQIVHAVDRTPGTPAPDDVRRRTRLGWLEGPTPRAHYPRTTHPMVLRHPRTRERVLFVNECSASHIDGLDPEVGERFIQHCFHRLYLEVNCYEHHWAAGDLAIWDNLALQYARAEIWSVPTHTLRRVVVSDQDLRAACAVAAGHSGVVAPG